MIEFRNLTLAEVERRIGELCETEQVRDYLMLKALREELVWAEHLGAE
jgi:hypothetical protein